MKKLKIGAYVRPAIYDDLFDKDLDTFFKKDTQVFYKNSENQIRGPYRITIPQFFLASEYDNYLQLIKEEKIYVIDGHKYLETIHVQLPLKTIELIDLIEFNHFNSLLLHTVFYIISDKNVQGPFLITKHTQNHDIEKYIIKKQFFVLDNPSNLKQINIQTAAQAV